MSCNSKKRGEGTATAKILIVHDKQILNDPVRYNLERTGHTCFQVIGAVAGLNEASGGGYDLVVLDAALPWKDSCDITEYTGGTPVMLVTSRTSPEKGINGLRIGAAACIEKPFDAVELVERVKALLRRTGSDINEFRFDDIRIDFSARRVYKSDAEVILTPKEFDLLDILVSNRNRTVPRSQLMQLVWGNNHGGNSHYVDSHISRLKHKLGIGDRILTIRKIGYRFRL